jgi:hypothetical protein
MTCIRRLVQKREHDSVSKYACELSEGTPTLISSACGMPSVIHTINPISFSIASIMASAAEGGGT